MTTISIELRDGLDELLEGINESMSAAALELMVFELYRRRSISSGKAAEFLSMGHIEFIDYASSLGLATLEMDPEQWKAERRSVNT